MKNICQLTSKYLKLKGLDQLSEEEKNFIKQYEQTLNKLTMFEKDFFINTYIKVNEEKWWSKFYSRSTFYRINKIVTDKFCSLYLANSC